ncbi:MAG: prolipoprotein diacylglyceryl transferase [Chitinophagales bacterium]
MILRAYPTVFDFINDKLPFLKDVFRDGEPFPSMFPNTYGFFVALAFLFAALVLRQELKRREQLNLLIGYPREVLVGAGPNWTQLLINGAISFFFGYKIIGAFTNMDQAAIDQMAYLQSSEGSILGGILAMALSIFPAYRKAKKEELPKPERRWVDNMPHEQIGEMVVIAAIFGILGAKIFDFLQPDRIQDFFKNVTALLSNPALFVSGLTVYGGLIFGGLAILVFAYRRKIHVAHLFDALGLSFLLAQGIGRLGCHFSGDGDWGIVNSNARPGWIPESFWSNTYAHNVINAGEPIPGCSGQYCYELSAGVYPTSIYEFFLFLGGFLLLFFLRKKLTHKPGVLFAGFLIFAGVERFLIEGIRVTSTGSMLGLTQAQMISLAMIVGGIGLMGFKFRKSLANPSSSVQNGDK